MRLINTFLKFDAEAFFKGKELQFIRVYDAYEKKYNEATKQKEKTDNKLGVWVELMVSKDNTDYEIVDNNTGEKEIRKSENYGEKFMCLVTDPSRNASDFDSFSIGDVVTIKGYQGEVIMGRYNDIYQPRVKDVVKKDATNHAEQQRRSE